MWFPDQELGVTVVSNLASFNPTQAGNKVAALFLAGKLAADPPKPEPATRNFITLEPAALQAFAGTYPLPAIGQTLETKVDQGKLWAVFPERPSLEMKAMAASRFYVGELSADIEFTPKPNGGMTAKITQPGGVNGGDRVAHDLLPVADYAGVYWSEELETEYTIRVLDGRLFAVHAHHGEFGLTPIVKDRFSSPRFFFSDVNFVRDERGKVTALTVGGGRVTAIRFERK
jgi:hypothetical protein